MIDFKFISELEGSSNDGCVPEPDGGAIESGVTVASGFDIGQHSVEEIDDHFDYELADKLAIYCGITGHDAIAKLSETSLELTDEECQQVNEYAHKKAVKNLIDDWEHAEEKPFGLLHPAMQTVIASVSFQYGDLPTRTPNFWRQATGCDVVGMLANLCNFGDRFQTRRKKEARYLFESLNEYGEYENLRHLIF